MYPLQMTESRPFELACRVMAVKIAISYIRVKEGPGRIRGRTWWQCSYLHLVFVDEMFAEELKALRRLGFRHVSPRKRRQTH